jgi:integrase
VASLASFAGHRGWRPRDVRDAALVSVVADSSRRRGEVWNLRRVDVARALERAEPLGGGRSVYHVESHGKTGPVSIRFYDESAMLLRRWLELLPAGAVFVFISLRTGERLRADALHLGLLRVCEFAGVKPFRFHAIRKRVVTEVIAATGDAKVGQLLAGHASERTTQMYYNDVQQAAVDVAAGALAAKYRGGGGSLADSFFRRI